MDYENWKYQVSRKYGNAHALTKAGEKAFWTVFRQGKSWEQASSKAFAIDCINKSLCKPIM